MNEMESVREEKLLRVGIYLRLSNEDKDKSNKEDDISNNEKKNIEGYFTLATAQVAFEEIPDDFKGKLPKYPIPALRIARLAVSKDSQGKGIGRWLLAQAFIKAVQVADVTGLYFIIVDAKESSKSFYEHYGFQKLYNKELCYFILAETVRKAIYQ